MLFYCCCCSSCFHNFYLHFLHSETLKWSFWKDFLQRFHKMHSHACYLCLLPKTQAVSFCDLFTLVSNTWLKTITEPKSEQIRNLLISYECVCMFMCVHSLPRSFQSSKKLQQFYQNNEAKANNFTVHKTIRRTTNWWNCMKVEEKIE